MIAKAQSFHGFGCRLFALGIMEYNTDWKVIQQLFLPCKSKHQVVFIMDSCYKHKCF